MADDLVQPFRVGRLGLRGQMVRLGPAIDAILSQHAYPPPVSTLLAELVGLTVVLGSTLKYDGIFTTQIKGDGAVRTLVADMTSTGALRGYADFDAEALGALGPLDPSAPVPSLVGRGYLAFTVDQGPDTERYQGIVELDGATLSTCAHGYFRRSEQIATGLSLAAGQIGNKWRSGALLLQRMPLAGGGESTDEFDEPPAPAEIEEDWRRAMILMSTADADELLAAELPPEHLLYRLFHEEGVRVHAPRPLHFACRCSRARIEATLRALPRAEIETLLIDGQAVVTCQFCNQSEIFDQSALDALYAA